MVHRPYFNQKISPNGYAWWYVDAESDDGQYAITVIFFIGSVFSPYYAKDRQQHHAVSADRYCAVNVALYHKNQHHWAHTEYIHIPLKNNTTSINIGNSSMHWHNNQLLIHICERTAPFGQLLQGDLTLGPMDSTFQPWALHANQAHWWWPIAPCTRIDVALQKPHSTWHGRAYHDANWGHRHLSDDIHGWNWQRAWHPQGTLVHYDITPRHDTSRLMLAKLFDHHGNTLEAPEPMVSHLSHSRWGMQRQARGIVREIRKLEDTPFYTRSQMMLQHQGENLHAIHEQLDLQRWDRPWVQFLLPFRMRRCTLSI